MAKGASVTLTSARPSAQNLLAAATSPAQPNAFAERMPFPPAAWSARSVSAAAMPLGKRNCSTLIICRFMGMAMVTPSTASRKTQASMTGSDITASLMSIHAAKAEISVPPVE
jgi:hypothetical protein